MVDPDGQPIDGPPTKTALVAEGPGAAINAGMWCVSSWAECPEADAEQVLVANRIRQAANCWKVIQRSDLE